MTRLTALMDGRIIGHIFEEQGRLSLLYSDDWRNARGAYPLSTSMPLAARRHADSVVRAFLWGLLPDNDQVLRRWGRKFQVSARNPFALISHVGEDCAGAVQFATDERLELLLAPANPGEIDWLEDGDIAERLRTLSADASAGRIARDTGQFSLAGAQPKTAFYSDGKRLGVPHGRIPTTHIFKPPTGDFDGFAENEHLCLNLAARLGMATARSRVALFEDVSVIIVERYDRRRVDDIVTAKTRQIATLSDRTENIDADRDARAARAVAALDAAKDQLTEELQALQTGQLGPVLRVHQEDYCQALGVHPENKYQNLGGPGVEAIISHLRAHTGRPGAIEQDVLRFRDALIFNWLIGGTDAHAKNYSILISAGGTVRLAPLYDMASILPYSDIDPRKVKLAMKIGDTYKLEKATAAEWTKLAANNGLKIDALVDRMREMAAAIPDLLNDEVKALSEAGVSHPICEVLQTVLTDRAARFTSI